MSAGLAALPAPRLQLRWERNTGKDAGQWQWLCHYEIVLPLREHDIRREMYDEDGEMTGTVSELVAALKEPSRRGSEHVPRSMMTGKRYCDAPYRDGAHAQWDSKALGDLPVYVIAPDGSVFIQEPNAELSRVAAEEPKHE